MTGSRKLLKTLVTVKWDEIDSEKSADQSIAVHCE
jgi:hypothetical protein